MNSISISIPAYNDGKTIEGVIKRSLKVLEEISPDYEVVVINDESSDNTQEVIENISKENSKVKVVHHQKNEGFGKTIKEVFELPSKEWVFFIPGDGQVSPEEIKKLIPYTDNADFILGVRSSRSDPIWRRFNSAIYNGIISIISGIRVKDVNSVALARRKILENLNITGDSAFVHAEIFLKVASSGYKIEQVEIEHLPRTSGKGSGNKISVIIPTVINLIKFIFRHTKRNVM
ncbi:MAG: glycosyltransferase family 2 protein [Elusimicrobiota bacterium]